MDSIRSIVVHVDASARVDTRLRMAQALASAMQAQLTALYAVTPAAYEVPLALADGSSIDMPLLRDVDIDRRNRARAAFDRVVDPGATPAPAWEDAGSAPIHTAVAARALTADLLVFGQHDSADPQTASTSDLMASTLIESGTPALVVPHSGHLDPQALTRSDLCVLLAWKPTREAARAMRAALPWLRRAQHVHLAVETPAERDGAWPGAASLRAWLALHGVRTGVRDHVVGRASPGELLLSMAADVSADLLVMGCFGHSRARELVLGGASRTVLQSMTLPTLLAH
ncbi:universal stress protein [Rubrivivax sp. RP6-9]|uniref:universal stress protein n=1 Tax=Rubrivivax sp. RP6-9 TaxID=3415750 RepID=UPI003CC59398